MTYIESVFICLAIPMMLSLLFTAGRARLFTTFVIIGMEVCLMSAYVNSFFMGISGADAIAAAIEITPVCEEILKILPMILYYLIFEPRYKELPAVAIAIAVGFATFENACYLAENGAQAIAVLLIRGFGAGALHLVCGIFAGFGMSYMLRWKWLALTGTVGVIGVCVGLHGIYNLLISAQGLWHLAGYLFPALLIGMLLVARKLWPRLHIEAQ